MMVLQSAKCLYVFAKENRQCSFEVAPTSSGITLVCHILTEIIIGLVFAILPKESGTARDIRITRSETETLMVFFDGIE